ncbi:unnamed protein product [Dicrocoelium dendriticum]|nr:unnamed protein product [Dicrocoelium dendriticum]
MHFTAFDRTRTHPVKSSCSFCYLVSITQLLFCASCAEPFHFYCVERQFRPRRKDHFICRNCTQCRQCRRSAADLRCVRCSGGYHPTCLPSYAPAQSSQRGNWVCPHCTSCVHCGAKPLKKSLDSSDDTESTVLWSPDCSKCAACGLAEARGDVCPECDRAYLPTAKQMIQCDTCQLWMHRTCTKLTTDEYEWIARLPTGRLNKYIVNCTVCQNEQNQRMAATSNSVDSGESSAKTDNLNGAERLRSLAKDTLMDRMATLVASCRRATASSDSINQLAQTHDSPELSKVSSRVQSALTFSLDNYKTGSLDRPAFPQVDGNFDEDSEAESVHGARQESSTDASMLPGCASDILLYEDANPLPIPSRLISISPDSCSNAPVLRRTEMRDRHRRTSGGRSERPKVCMSSVRPLSSLGPPPTTAYWLTESETAEIWTSPRILLYRVLTRVIHRLSAHPIDSLYAVVLRRMLKWLSAATEYLFPWLDITEMANDVRDVLRQAKGEFAAVWRHFENCALLELHELLCPVIARTTGRLLYSQSLLFPSSARPWADMAAVDQCISTVSQHIKAHHHSDVLIPPDDTPRKLSEFKHIIALKDLLMQCPSSQCHRPHELEMLEKMKTESREERWVEHWSATEEKMVLRNFQRCLLRQSQRLAASSIQQRKTQPSNFGENCSEHSVFTHPSGITTMDDTSHSERTAIANDYCDNKVKNEPVITFKSQSLMSAKFQPGEVDVKELRRSAPQFFKHPAQFYFADCDFWASMPDVAPPTNCTKEPPVDLDEDPEPRSALDFTSDEEDVRPCLLCGHHGDNGIEGRLLFTGADTWPSCGVDSHGHCSSMAKAPAAPARIPKLSLTWNIDEPETSRLHGMMNASLIFKSLNMSPIHWKCVPQLCGLRGKHCASICGVIIRRKRKGAKRICDAPANSNDNEW